MAKVDRGMEMPPSGDLEDGVRMEAMPPGMEGAV